MNKRNKKIATWVGIIALVMAMAYLGSKYLVIYESSNQISCSFSSSDTISCMPISGYWDAGEGNNTFSIFINHRTFVDNNFGNFETFLEANSQEFSAFSTQNPFCTTYSYQAVYNGNYLGSQCVGTNKNCYQSGPQNLITYCTCSIMSDYDSSLTSLGINAWDMETDDIPCSGFMTRLAYGWGDYKDGVVHTYHISESDIINKYFPNQKMIVKGKLYNKEPNQFPDKVRDFTTFGYCDFNAQTCTVISPDVSDFTYLPNGAGPYATISSMTVSLKVGGDECQTGFTKCSDGTCKTNCNPIPINNNIYYILAVIAIAGFGVFIFFKTRKKRK